MRFAIFGSGFGLYGYLPALLESGQQVILPSRYYKLLIKRKELEKYISSVSWEIDESKLLDCIDGIVIALQPKQQYEWVLRCLKISNIKYMMLEKPLALSPQNAAKLMNDLYCSESYFRVGYTFRYTSWGKELLAILDSNIYLSKISIQWMFQAHHFTHKIKTWKRYNSFGGGVVRFYGIHIIALLAEAGYKDVFFSKTVSSSADEPFSWHAIFIGKQLPPCEIMIDSQSTVNCFQIMQKINNKKKLLVDMLDPFALSSFGSLDRRVPIVSKLCDSLLNEPSASKYQWYRDVIYLWNILEHKNRDEIVK